MEFGAGWFQDLISARLRLCGKLMWRVRKAAEHVGAVSVVCQDDKFIQKFSQDTVSR